MFVHLSLSANSDLKYKELFEKLENSGIVIGRDISSEELFELVNSPNSSDLYKKIESLLSIKEQQSKQIHDKLKANPNSKVNKEILIYLKDHNKRVEEAQENIRKNSENDSFFTKTINYILDLYKY
jgi:hypothetical protein